MLQAIPYSIFFILLYYALKMKAEANLLQEIMMGI